MCDGDGVALAGDAPPAVAPAVLARSVRDALAIGDGVVVGGDGAFAWVCPLTVNGTAIGGLVAWITERDLFPHGTRAPTLDVRTACRSLIDAATAAQLTDRALLDARLVEHRREQERAGLLHRLKHDAQGGVAAAYLAVESELVEALRAGDRGRGRNLVNRVLVVALHQAGGELPRARSLLLELVVLLRHTALAAGGAAHLLPESDRLLSALNAATDDAAVAAWLRRTLETLFDCLHLPRGDADSALTARLLRTIAARCAEPLTRDGLAAELGISPRRLTRLLRRSAGGGLSDAIARARVDRARVLLEHGEEVLAVALAVGFSDPSNFARTFRRHTGVPPSVWRERMARG